MERIIMKKKPVLVGIVFLSTLLRLYKQDKKGTEIRSFTTGEYSGYFNCVAFSPDERYILAAYTGCDSIVFGQPEYRNGLPRYNDYSADYAQFEKIILTQGAVLNILC
jgi:hypothetical protein